METAGLDDLQVMLIKSYIEQYDKGNLPFTELRNKILNILGVELDNK